VLPKPLQKLYDRASLFLDKESTHQDHYWAVGIHKAIHASFPESGGSHTPANPKRSTEGVQRPVRQDPPLIRNHICDTPNRCSVADIAREIREEEMTKLSIGVSYVAVSLPSQTKFVSFTVRDEKDLQMWERARRNNNVRYSRTKRPRRRKGVMT